MSAPNDMIAETRKADDNLHRFISDERWQRIHDNSARDYKSGEWFREKIFGVGRMRRELFSLATGDVLDVACGYGSNFGYLTNAAHITGIDVSPVMLDMARGHARQLNLSSWELIGRFQDRGVVGSIEHGGCRVNQEPQQIIQAAGLKITSARRSVIGIFHVIQVSPA